MLDFFFLPETRIFVIALGLMFAVGVLELLSMLIGAGLFAFLDDLIPDVEMDADTDISFLEASLSWLHIGRVPVLVSVVVFLTFFGLSGLFLQQISQWLFASMFSAWLVVVPAFILSLPVMRFLGGLVAHIVPKEETSAVSQESFRGKLAIVVMGPAKRGLPVQARLKDEFGQTHYVLVEPQTMDDEFEQGCEIVLLERQGAVFEAIRFEYQ